MLSLATTRLITHHISGDKSILASLSDRFDYGQNPEKTLDGALIRSYECDPLTADSEFLLSKARYKAITGREQKRDADVLCYQIRQSFPPGELDPEEALNIGYELAMRWTKGKHAFFVVSHADRPHPHVHILQLHHSGLHPEIPGFFRLRPRSAAAVRPDMPGA